MALFESYERRIEKINSVLSQYGIKSVEECRDICKAAGFDPYEIVKGIQPICFENACWAYCVGAAIALKKNVATAAEAAEAIGEGLQAFCISGSVAEDRKVGLGHGNLGAMLDGGIGDEAKLRAAAHLEAAAQLPADIPRPAGEALDAFLRPFQAGDRADIHLAAGLVPGKIHLYDGKQGINAGVLEAPENIGQLPVDILPQAGGFK